MIVEKSKLESRNQTAYEIYQLINEFYLDLLPYKSYTLDEFYQMVRDIPYLEDMEEREVVSRPQHLLNEKYFTMLDCKKKNTLIGSFLKMKNIPYLLVSGSDVPIDPPHHIFVIAWIDNDWKRIDATLQSDQIFEDKTQYNYEVFLND